MKLLSIAALVLGSVTLVSVPIATATPIQPDIKKLLSTPRPTQHFAPARVGWNGPEASTTDALPAARFGMVPQRDLRQTLLQLAIPDWRVFLALGALIILLRQLRKRGHPAHAHALYNVPVDVGEPEVPSEVHRPAA